MRVKVEYKRTRNKAMPVTPEQLAKLPRSRNRQIDAQEWADNARANRNVEAKARQLVRKYGLIEHAIDHAFVNLRKYQLDSEDPGRAYWLAVYKWLRRHEDLGRRAPHLLGWHLGARAA